MANKASKELVGKTRISTGLETLSTISTGLEKKRGQVHCMTYKYPIPN